MPNILHMMQAGSGFGVVPATPTLQYVGSGWTDNGKFRIADYDPGFVYSPVGGTVGYDAGLGFWVFTVSAATGSGALTCKAAKGITSSGTRTAYRHAADQTNVPYTQCSNPCGNCRTDVDPHTWSCGCGSGCNDSGGGQWGDCICRGPGYNYWNNYSPYGWSGSDYNNGQGEWWYIA